MNSRFSPTLTRRWSKDEVIQYLKIGTNNWTLASGPMAPNPAPVAADDKAVRAGAAIYKDNCAACHRDAGTGEAQLFPHLAGSALVQSVDPTTLVRVVVQGTRAASTPGTPTAPAFGWKLGDDQIGAVLTFIRNSWGTAASPVSAADVADRKATLAKLR